VQQFEFSKELLNTFSARLLDAGQFSVPKSDPEFHFSRIEDTGAVPADGRQWLA
jgi:hypothetical protein